MSESFRFRFNGVKVKASGALKIDPSLLQLGRILYFGVMDELPDEELEVKSGYNQKFTKVSEEQFLGALKLRIDHISWTSKVVLLVRRYEVNMERLFIPLKEVCSFEEFVSHVEQLQELPDDWKSATEDWKTHPLGFVESIVHRLQTVDRLVAEASDPWFPLAKSGLALFILCTCVESLGRTREFFSYHDWLKSARTRTEVLNVINRCKSEGLLRFLNSVLKRYQSIFGFRRSFTNFFHNLPEQWQHRLAETTDIMINRPPDFKMKREGDPLDNLVEYLETFRNKFAHGMELIYQVPLEGEVPDKWKESWSTKFELTQFWTYQEVYGDGSFKTVMTRNLLGTLNQAIRIALWEWIKNHS